MKNKNKYGDAVLEVEPFYSVKKKKNGAHDVDVFNGTKRLSVG